jgi:hypothetical protein
VREGELEEPQCPASGRAGGAGAPAGGQVGGQVDVPSRCVWRSGRCCCCCCCFQELRQAARGSLWEAGNAQAATADRPGPGAAPSALPGTVPRPYTQHSDFLPRSLPNAVEYYGAFHDPDFIFIIMEFCSGGCFFMSACVGGMGADACHSSLPCPVMFDPNRCSRGCIGWYWRLQMRLPRQSLNRPRSACP